MSLWLPLDTNDASISLAGGKGSNLARLTRYRFPVPPGFILTTAAYTAFAEAHALNDWVLAQVRALPSDDQPALEAASARIRSRFASEDLPSAVATALSEAYTHLGRPPVAVRSSATAEDLPGFSFAGQQDTFLNVIGDEALKRAVRDCWSSLWTARAMAYRTRNGIDHADVTLAVVVQAMIPSESSGVLFTANPLTGRRSETVIDATLGLGEALVSGQVEPDHYVVDAHGQITSKSLGAKALSIRVQPGGGTVTVQAAGATQQALSDAQILALADLGRRIADRFGAPQDIEWASAGGQLHILQTRPVTTLYPLPDGLPATPLRFLISLGSVQGVLGPLTPLGRDTLITALINIGSVFGHVLTLASQTVLWEAGERLWVNTTGLINNRVGRRLSLAALPYVEPNAAMVLKQLIAEGDFSEPGPLRARTLIGLLRVFIPMMWRALRTFAQPEAERTRLLARLEHVIDTAQAKISEAPDLEQRIGTIRPATAQAFAFVLPHFVPRFAVGMASYNLLTHLANRLPPGTCDTRVMMRSVPHNVTTEMDLILWEAAQTIAANDVARKTFEENEASALVDAYRAGHLPPAAQATVAQFLERYGMRGTAEIDLAQPRWRDEPLSVLQTLRAYLAVVGTDQAPDIVYARGRQAAEAEIERLANALRQTRGGWFKAKLVRWAGRRMRAMIGIRESPKLTLIRILGTVRQALLDDGAKLVRKGVIQTPDDLFYLKMDELEALGREEQRDWGALIKTRRECYVREEHRTQIPRLLLSDGRAFYGTAVSTASETGDTLHGEPVSPGTVENVVHVVLDPRSAHLAPGEILVCPGTDPSWTPLFLTAGGLVMEVGGMMTHGAVVAREYGLPAIASVPEATRRLHTGQRVRVDGSSGQITLLDERGS